MVDGDACVIGAEDVEEWREWGSGKRVCEVTTA